MCTCSLPVPHASAPTSPLRSHTRSAAERAATTASASKLVGCINVCSAPPTSICETPDCLRALRIRLDYIGPVARTQMLLIRTSSTRSAMGSLRVLCFRRAARSTSQRTCSSIYIKLHEAERISVRVCASARGIFGVILALLFDSERRARPGTARLPWCKRSPRRRRASPEITCCVSALPYGRPRSAPAPTRTTLATPPCNQTAPTSECGVSKPISLCIAPPPSSRARVRSRGRRQATLSHVRRRRLGAAAHRTASQRCREGAPLLVDAPSSLSSRPVVATHLSIYLHTQLLLVMAAVRREYTQNSMQCEGADEQLQEMAELTSQLRRRCHSEFGTLRQRATREARNMFLCGFVR